MTFQIVIVLLSLVFTPYLVYSTTTYQCYDYGGGTSPEYSKQMNSNCVRAFTSAVSKQAGCDGNAFITFPPASASYQNSPDPFCYARVYATTGNQVVPTINLLESFSQLESRCYYGIFKYNDDGVWGEVLPLVPSKRSFGFIYNDTETIKGDVEDGNKNFTSEVSKKGAEAAHKRVSYCEFNYPGGYTIFRQATCLGVELTSEVIGTIEWYPTASQIATLVANTWNDVVANANANTHNQLSQTLEITLADGSEAVMLAALTIIPDAENWGSIVYDLGYSAFQNLITEMIERAGSYAHTNAFWDINKASDGTTAVEFAWVAFHAVDAALPAS